MLCFAVSDAYKLIYNFTNIFIIKWIWGSKIFCSFMFYFLKYYVSVLCFIDVLISYKKVIFSYKINFATVLIFYSNVYVMSNLYLLSIIQSNSEFLSICLDRLRLRLPILSEYKYHFSAFLTFSRISSDC